MFEMIGLMYGILLAVCAAGRQKILITSSLIFMGVVLSVLFIFERPTAYEIFYFFLYKVLLFIAFFPLFVGIFKTLRKHIGK